MPSEWRDGELERLAFDRTRDALCVAGFDGSMRRANAAFARMLGMAEEDLLGRPFFDNIHPSDHDIARAAVADLAAGHDIVGLEIRGLRADGSFLWIEWNASPQLDDGVFFCVGRDITERRLARKQLAALRRVATRIAQAEEPQAIFAFVAEEVARVIDASVVNIGSYTNDGTVKEVGGFWAEGEGIAVGSWPPDGKSVAASVGSPIVVAGRLWGTIIVGTREAGKLPPDTEARLSEFTELLAVAIANADSRSELEASRRRLVAASDAARRRIERNLHDGTQQRLVALGLAVRAAEANVPEDRDDLRVELSRVADGLAAATTELQELSRRIHPANLSKGGLAAAIRGLGRRSSIPIELDIATEMRMPEPVEVGAFYIVSEALANAAKHSNASRIDVSLALRDGRVRLAVADNGVGGADAKRGSGLVGLIDRVEAIGGAITIDSPPGDGTRITAELPLDPLWTRMPNFPSET